MDFASMDVYEQRDWALGQLKAATIENANLKNNLAILTGFDLDVQVRIKYGLSKGPANVLAVLYRARGRGVGLHTINMAMETIGKKRDRDDITDDVIKVFVCHARKKIGKDAILTTSFGYALSHRIMEEFDLMTGYKTETAPIQIAAE